MRNTFILIILVASSLACSRRENVTMSYVLSQRDTSISFQVECRKFGNEYDLSCFSSKTKENYKIRYSENDSGIYILDSGTYRIAYSFLFLDSIFMFKRQTPPYFNYSSELIRIVEINYNSTPLQLFEFNINHQHGDDSQMRAYYLKNYGFVSFHSPNFDALYRIKDINSSSDNKVSSTILYVSDLLCDSLENESDALLPDFMKNE